MYTGIRMLARSLQNSQFVNGVWLKREPSSATRTPVVRPSGLSAPYLCLLDFLTRPGPCIRHEIHSKNANVLLPARLRDSRNPCENLLLWLVNTRLSNFCIPFRTFAILMRRQSSHNSMAAMGNLRDRWPSKMNRMYCVTPTYVEDEVCSGGSGPSLWSLVGLQVAGLKERNGSSRFSQQERWSSAGAGNILLSFIGLCRGEDEEVEKLGVY